MPPCSSIPAAGLDPAGDGGARSLLASRWRRSRATTGSQRGLPAAPGRGSPSPSSSVSASTPPFRRQIHECAITSKGNEADVYLEDGSEPGSHGSGVETEEGMSRLIGIR